MPGNNLYPQSPGVGEVSSAVERYAPPTHPSRPAAGHAHPPGSGPRELLAGLGVGGTARGSLPWTPGLRLPSGSPGRAPELPGPVRNPGDGAGAGVAGVSAFLGGLGRR